MTGSALVRAKMASGIVLALGVADLAVLNLLLAPRLKEGPRVSVAAAAEVYVGTPAEAPAKPAPAAPTPAECPPPPPAKALVSGDAPCRNDCPEAIPDVVFQYGEVQVPAGRGADVKRVADALREGADRRLVLRGHADRLGSTPANLRLSRQRAENVLRLLKAFGAPVDRVIIEAAGSTEPASPSDTPLGWARNRRVQLLWR
jgi:outer membrane protein OmpA-like peptidoglycan-associated protein